MFDIITMIGYANTKKKKKIEVSKLYFLCSQNCLLFTLYFSTY